MSRYCSLDFLGFCNVDTAKNQLQLRTNVIHIPTTEYPGHETLFQLQTLHRQRQSATRSWDWRQISRASRPVASGRSVADDQAHAVRFRHRSVLPDIPGPAALLSIRNGGRVSDVYGTQCSDARLDALWAGDRWRQFLTPFSRGLSAGLSVMWRPEGPWSDLVGGGAFKETSTSHKSG